MKILKKFLMISLFALISMCFITSAPSKQSASASVLYEDVFDYVSISRYGQALTLENFKTINDSTYIITNDSLTITLKPFQYNYSIEYSTMENPNFVAQIQEIHLPFDEALENYPDNFLVAEKTYYYRLNNITDDLSIYAQSPADYPTINPVVSTGGSYGSNIIGYRDDIVNKVRTIYYTTSYTLVSNAVDTTFFFRVKTSGNNSRLYDLNFLRPVVEFSSAENPVVNFTCSGLDAGENDYSDTTIKREKAYNHVSIDFLTNKYTEANPLYFKINYNGFTYDFEFYSKLYGTENLLFVNYMDPIREQNNCFLATKMSKDINGEYMVVTTGKIPAYMDDGEINQFTLDFSQTGRYEIEFYDSTYVYGIENANYYKTSFYIRDESKSAFDNIYIIAQTQDDESNDIEYIVSTSTLNNNVKATIKNLTNLGTDGEGNIIKLEDVLEKITITKTIFVGGENVHTYETYTPSDILKKMVNGDLVLTYNEDAIYQIEIFKKDDPNSYKYYEFTIVKLTKVTFSVPVLDENGEAVKVNGKTQLISDQAKEAFITDRHDYEMNIISNMNISFETTFYGPGNINLPKTYVNKYHINYGVEQVKIEQYVPTVEEGEKKIVALDLKCFGVGDLTVTVKHGGKEEVFYLNSETGPNSLQFTDYGTYTIKIVDSMGTTETFVFKFEKSLNTSALILIILSSTLAVVIILFILKARGKISTR